MDGILLDIVCILSTSGWQKYMEIMGHRMKILWMVLVAELKSAG